jgi:hypothetical protein
MRGVVNGCCATHRLTRMWSSCVWLLWLGMHRAAMDGRDESLSDHNSSWREGGKGGGERGRGGGRDRGGKKIERKYFEDELRALQDDISYLSRKLSLPISSSETPLGTRGGGRSSHLQGERGQRNGYESDPVDQVIPPLCLVPSLISTLQLSDRNFTESESERGEHPKGQVARLQRQVRSLARERDDALYQLKQLQHENDHLKQLCEDRTHLKSTCEHLLQDVESLKISLQSSESIRKQQKELLLVLQRSQSLMDSSRHHSIPHLQSDDTVSLGSNGHHSHLSRPSLHGATSSTAPVVMSPPTLTSPPSSRDRQHSSTPSKRLTRKKTTSLTPSSSPPSTGGPHSTPRHKPTSHSSRSAPRFTAPSSDSDTSSRYSATTPRHIPRHQTSSLARPSALQTPPPSVLSRPPLAPQQSHFSPHSPHLAHRTSTPGTNKVKSRPQSAPPASSAPGSTRPRGSFLSSFHSPLERPDSRGRR